MITKETTVGLRSRFDEMFLKFHSMMNGGFWKVVLGGAFIVFHSGFDSM
ncbi:MAG: hypothetical protein KKF56_01930 [Nanoarchaeota archaeon]|nr:hypothetical protein [Nanoarchaeota archaeon]